jgi:transcriptional regulator with PAS, ATPase and Fis domain
MRDLFRMLERIGATHATVLITGENGTGKELVARAVHEGSARAGKRFLATNCGAFNDNLLESEMFGHKRGAFTGAVADKPGLFEIADGGTLFLDEVGDMSPALQVKLLRVLQEGTFTPVGGTETRKVDVRIVAATNRDLGELVKRGAFREDLYYRLHVVALRVPALRDRIEDLPLLVAHFLERLARRDGRRKVLSAAAMEALAAHRWPGNVRELENELERLWVLSGDDVVIGDELLSAAIARVRRPGRASAPPAGPAAPWPTAPWPTAPWSAAPRPAAPGPAPAHAMGLAPGEAATPEAVAANTTGAGSDAPGITAAAPDPSPPDSSPPAPSPPAAGRTSAPPDASGAPDLASRLLQLLPATLPEAVDRVERLMITAALQRARGNKTRAAEALGISRRNLIRKVQAFGLGPADDDLDG